MNNESKTKRHQNEHPTVKKLIELTQKAKQKDGRSYSKNPEECPIIKDLHKSI